MSPSGETTLHAYGAGGRGPLEDGGGTRHTYTGKELERETGTATSTGLMNDNARMYDPVLGRFLTGALSRSGPGRAVPQPVRLRGEYPRAIYRSHGGVHRGGLSGWRAAWDQVPNVV